MAIGVLEEVKIGSGRVGCQVDVIGCRDGVVFFLRVGSCRKVGLADLEHLA